MWLNRVKFAYFESGMSMSCGVEAIIHDGAGGIDRTQASQMILISVLMVVL